MDWKIFEGCRDVSRLSFLFHWDMACLDENSCLYNIAILMGLKMLTDDLENFEGDFNILQIHHDLMMIPP